MELKELYALMERFEKSGLSELLFKQNGDEVCLKKGVPVVPAVIPRRARPASRARAAAAGRRAADQVRRGHRSHPGSPCGHLLPGGRPRRASIRRQG